MSSYLHLDILKLCDTEQVTQSAYQQLLTILQFFLFFSHNMDIIKNMARLYLILLFENVIYVHATSSCQTVKGRVAAIFLSQDFKKALFSSTPQFC